MKKWLVVVAFALSGCAGGNTQPVAMAPGTLPAGIMPMHSSGGRLIYVADTASNTLTFYSYKTGKEQGSITSGLASPQGVCSDSQGNIFLANTDDFQVLEFAHGGTTPIQKIATTGQYPGGCAVFKGTLAVVGICSSSDCGQGALLLYANETGSPTMVTCPNLYHYYFATYDGSGNLFAVGDNVSGDFGFCEVPQGTSQGIAITLDSPPSFPAPLQWDGKYIVTMAAGGDVLGRYSISGSSGTLEGTVTLSGAQEIFTLASRKVVLAATSTGYGLWKYPSGGNPYKSRQLQPTEISTLALSPPAKL